MIVNDENYLSGNSQNQADISTDSSKNSQVSAAALQVFGDILLDEGHSLCYSPSPYYRKKKLSNITNILNSQPHTLSFDNEKNAKPKQTKKLLVTSSIKKNVAESPKKKKDDSKKQNMNPENSPKIKPKTSYVRPAKRNMSNKHKVKNSPVIRTLAERTQKAIEAATESVNQGISAGRLAKRDHLKIVQETTSEIRDEWKSQKEEAAAFHAEAQKIKRENIDLRNQLSSQFSKLRAQRQRSQYRSKLATLQEEIEFNSNVYVSHKSKLKEMEDERRRKSIAIREIMRKEKREAESRIRLQQFEEELALLEERNQSSVAWREASKAEAEKRRKSFAFRNAEGVRQRREEEERSAQHRSDDHDSYELKWAGERDAEAYKKQCDQDRRDSFAFRNAEGVRQRMEAEERSAQNKAEDHDSYELKWAGERDAEAYKKQCDQDRRDSFAFRNAEGVRQRREEEERTAQQRSDDHDSYELKWAGERDAEAYKKQCDHDRRDSFAFRNAEGVLHRAVMEELKALSLEKDHEDFILKWAGENDAKAYEKEQAELRRASLAFRNKEGKRHRDLEEETRLANIENAHDEELLQAGCQKDIESYKASCAARDRASFQFRLKESRIQRLEAQNQRDRDFIENQKNRAIDDGARNDVKEYIKECKAKRRQSLAFRAKEKRRHARWERKQFEKEIRERSRNTHYATLDSRYMQLAKEKERAQEALDALRHRGCSFSSNPFSFLLD